MSVEDTIIQPTADMFETNGSTLDPGTWMVVGAPGVINPPLTTWVQATINGGYNLGGVPWGGAGCTVVKPVTFVVTLPTTLNYGGSYRFNIGLSDDFQNGNAAIPSQALHYEADFTVCTPPSNLTLQKRAEGVANPGDPILYWLDYDAINSTNITVTDPLPAGVTFLGAAPGYIGPPLGTVCPCNITWNLGNANAGSTPAYHKNGSLWVEVQVPSGAVSGTNIPNLAQISSTEQGAIPSNSVSLTVSSGLNISLSKGQFDASGTNQITNAKNGDTVDYQLHFTLSGLGLKCYDSFDELPANATYNGPAAPPNWTAVSENNDGTTWANWQVIDDGTGNHYLKATTTNYGFLEYQCANMLNAQNNYCEGTIESDIYMGSAATDLGILIRSNGQTGANFRGIWLLMSKDTSFGTGCSGNLAIQFNTSDSTRTVEGCYTAGVSNVPNNLQWYTMKVVTTQTGCAMRYQAKYWVRGTPEPPTWMVDYTDSSRDYCNDPQWACEGNTGAVTNEWRPGVGNQGDNNQYDNFRVFTNNYLQNASLTDPIPTGITFSSVVSGVASKTSPFIQWDFAGNQNGATSGKIYDASGVMEWKGIADCSAGAAAATNVGALTGQNSLGVNTGVFLSNQTILALSCTTNTPTNTPTITPTPTPTNTSTITPTNTPTNSPTDTPSVTSTNTATNTPTITPTYTPTDSPTITPTDTITNTPTITPTPTPTNSPTDTPTITPTDTPTSTPTPFWEVNINKTVSDTQPKSGEALTYSIEVNVPGNTASNVNIVDMVPPGLTFVGVPTPSNPPGGSVSVTSLPTIAPTPGTGTILAWNFPSMPPGSYTFTYTTNVNSFMSAGTVIVNQAAMTFLQSAMTQVVQAPVTVQGSYAVKINVYNEAGEVVKTILEKQYSEPVLNITLVTKNVLESIHDIIQVVYKGIVIGSWDGTNNNGDLVTNGNYYIKVDNIDAFGSVDTVSQIAMVARHLAHVQVNIYNETGEIVRHLAATVDDAVTLTNGFSLSSDTISPKYQGGANSSVNITLGDGTVLNWDGRSDTGQIVSNGQYFIEARTNDGQGSDATVTKEISVIHSALTIGNGQVLVFPNPLSVQVNGMQVNFIANASPQVTLSVRIYTIMGELVDKVASPPGASQLIWDFSGRNLASGLYLAVIESTDAMGGVQRQTTKLAIIH